ncbi:MAG: NAD(P)-dependent oxidoreductase [Saprospiraceae bacterium]
MNILIVGASGLLGLALVEELQNSNRLYIAARSVSDKAPHSWPNHSINIELCDFSTLAFPKDIEAVYYLAQSREFRDFPEGASDMFKVNIEAPLKLIQWAHKNNVKKFIYASSGGVYKNPSQPVKEFFNVNANEDYGFYLGSKLSAEILLRNFAQYFETFIIARPFFMYGAGQNKTMLIPRLIQNVIDHKTITINENGGIKINPIYVTDAAKAFAKFLELQGDHLINIAGNETVSLQELCEKIGIIVKKSPNFDILFSSQNDLIADISLMKNRLHLPEISLEKGLVTTFNAMTNDT